MFMLPGMNIQIQDFRLLSMPPELQETMALGQQFKPYLYLQTQDLLSYHKLQLIITEIQM